MAFDLGETLSYGVANSGEVYPGRLPPWPVEGMVNSRLGGYPETSAR